MDETAEARRIRLHAEVDADFRPILDAVKGTATGIWAMRDILWLQIEEKLHVDKFGERFPKVTNIQVPQNWMGDFDSF